MAPLTARATQGTPLSLRKSPGSVALATVFGSSMGSRLEQDAADLALVLDALRRGSEAGKQLGHPRASIRPFVF